MLKQSNKNAFDQENSHQTASEEGQVLLLAPTQKLIWAFASCKLLCEVPCSRLKEIGARMVPSTLKFSLWSFFIANERNATTGFALATYRYVERCRSVQN